MTPTQWKKIARLLKEVYAEIEKEAIANNVDIFSDEYKLLIDKARENVLTKMGFTIEEYKQIKDEIKKARESEINSKITEIQKKVEEIPQPIIPTEEEIALIANKEAIKVFNNKPILPPQIINKIVKETTIREPKIIKETIKVKERVEYNDKPLIKELKNLDKKINDIKIPTQEKINIEKLKEEIKTEYSSEFGENLKNNINILNMPDFRKLAMGLQGQIDEVKASIIGSEDVGGLNTQVQFNDNGVFGGDANFTWDKTVLYVNGKIGIGTSTPVMKLHVAGTTSNDKIQADIGLNFSLVAMHGAFTPVLLTLAGNINAGNHYYTLSYSTAIGNTNLTISTGNSTYSGQVGLLITTDATHAQVDIPVVASSDYRVTNINIYRYNGTIFQLVVSLPNTTQTYRDNKTNAQCTGDGSIRYSENQTNEFIRLNNAKSMFLGDLTTLFGQSAGARITTGTYNTLFGSSAGNAITTGAYNTFIGNGAGSMYNGSSLSSNTAIGTYVMRYSQTALNNVVIGLNSGTNLNGNVNTLVGYQSGYNITTGAGNTFLGYATNVGTTGSYNTFIGYVAGSNVIKSYGIGLGYYAHSYETASNTLIIDGINRGTEALSRSSALIYGIMNATPANQILQLGGGGKVGIGKTPVYNLDVLTDINCGGVYRVGAVAGINATVSYTDTILGAKTLTFVGGILTAQV